MRRLLSYAQLSRERAAEVAAAESAWSIKPVCPRCAHETEKNKCAMSAADVNLYFPSHAILWRASPWVKKTNKSRDSFSYFSYFVRPACGDFLLLVFTGA